MRLLLVTDRSLAASMQPALEEDGVSVEVVDQAERAEYRAQTSDPDAVLLDRGLLKAHTNSCLLRWRRGGLSAHVLVLLPRESASAERAECLDAGADAYLLKPLSADELRA